MAGTDGSARCASALETECTDFQRLYDAILAVTACHLLYCHLLCATQPSVNDLTSPVLQAA